jgi:hypothetical protein
MNTLSSLNFYTNHLVVIRPIFQASKFEGVTTKAAKRCF